MNINERLARLARIEKTNEIAADIYSILPVQLIKHFDIYHYDIVYRRPVIRVITIDLFEDRDELFHAVGNKTEELYQCIKDMEQRAEAIKEIYEEIEEVTVQGFYDSAIELIFKLRN